MNSLDSIRNRLGYVPELDKCTMDVMLLLTRPEVLTLRQLQELPEDIVGLYDLLKRLEKATLDGHCGFKPIAPLSVEVVTSQATANVTFVNDYVFSRALLSIEVAVYRALVQSLRSDFKQTAFSLALCKEVEAGLGHSAILDLTQRQAVMGMVQNRISIVDGGPGAGKSRTISAMVNIVIDRGLYNASEVAILATTNQSSALHVDLSCTVMTLHKALGFNPFRNCFSRTSQSPLPYKLIIVEEASMLELSAFYTLLDSMPPDARLVLVGDGEQLGSVAPGDIFFDLCNLQLIPRTKLSGCYRSNAEIQVLLGSLRDGAVHHFENCKTTHIISAPSNRKDYYVKLLKILLRLQETGIHILNDLQLLSPVHKGFSGELEINELLHQTLSPGRFPIDVGDKVRIGKTATNFTQGEMVFVSEVSQCGGSYKCFNDRKPEGAFIRQPSQPKLGHCLTIHESQGSEWSNGVICIRKKDFGWIGRRGILTAISRFRNSVTLYTDASPIDLAELPLRNRITLAHAFGYNTHALLQFIEQEA